MSGDTNALDIFIQLYGNEINSKVRAFLNKSFSDSAYQHVVSSKKSEGPIEPNSVGFICFVRDINGNWVNYKVEMENKRSREKVTTITLTKTNGIIVRKLEIGKDVLVFDRTGQSLGYIPKGSGTYYLYINLRYTTANPNFAAKFDDKVGLETYNNRTVSEFIDYVIRTQVNPSPNTTDNNDNNFSEKRNIDESYLNPQTPKTEGTTTPNTQNNEYTPSPTFQPGPAMASLSYVVNNNVYTTTIGDINTNTNIQTTTTNNNNYNGDGWDPDEKFIYPIPEEPVNVQLDDIDNREVPVNSNDVLASDAEVLDNLANTMIDEMNQLEEPDLSFIAGLAPLSDINNPFANVANDLGGAEFEMNEPPGFDLGPQIQPPNLAGLLQGNVVAADEPFVEDYLGEFLEGIAAQQADIDLQRLAQQVADANMQQLDADVANAGIVGAANPIGIFRFLRNPIPNMGLYLPNSLRNKWVLLGITSSVIVGSFAFLLLTQYDSIRRKVSSLTASFVNSLKPTLPNEPVQLVEVDSYNNPIGTLNTPQQVIDSYVNYLKASDSLTLDEHLLLDPMLESVVVDTITIKEDNKASSFTYINLKESLANAYTSASHAFSKYIPDVFKSKSNLEVPPSTETDSNLLLVNDTVLSPTNVIDKVKNVLNYLWGILVFLLKNAADLLIKAMESLVGLLGNGIWLLVGAAALGLKWYFDRK